MNAKYISRAYSAKNQRLTRRLSLCLVSECPKEHHITIRRQLANRGLSDVVAAWEREHGAFSDDELAAARALVDG